MTWIHRRLNHGRTKGLLMSGTHRPLNQRWPLHPRTQWRQPGVDRGQRDDRRGLYHGRLRHHWRQFHYRRLLGRRCLHWRLHLHRNARRRILHRWRLCWRRQRRGLYWQWHWRLSRWRRHHSSGWSGHDKVDVKDPEVDSDDTERDSDSSRKQDDDWQPTQVEQDDEVDDPVRQRPENDDNNPRVEPHPLSADVHRPTCGGPAHRLPRLRLLRLHLLDLRNVQQRAAADAAHSRHSILVDHHCRQGLQYRLSAVRLPVHVAMVENSGVATQPDGGELLDIGWDLVDADLGNTRPRRGLRGLLLKVVDQSLAVAC